MSSFHLEQLKRVSEGSETTQLNGQELHDPKMANHVKI